MNIKKQFTTVTLLSKILALALFIALPFIGFCVGVNYQTSIASGSFVISKSNTLKQPIAQPTIYSKTCAVPKTTTWQKYTNPAGFSLRYPVGWKVKSLAATGENKTDHVYGPQGNIDVTWGSGLGGACGANGEMKDLTPMVFNGERFNVCDITESNGGERMSLISKDLGKGVGFTAEAVIKSPATQNKCTIEAVLSTLTFGK